VNYRLEYRHEWGGKTCYTQHFATTADIDRAIEAGSGAVTIAAEVPDLELQACANSSLAYA